MIIAAQRADFDGGGGIKQKFGFDFRALSALAEDDFCTFDKRVIRRSDAVFRRTESSVSYSLRKAGVSKIRGTKRKMLCCDVLCLGL